MSFVSNTARAIEQTQQLRLKRLAELQADPFFGYDTLDAAIADCRFTSQVEVLARLLNRENLFISGMAGSGKTTIINRFIELIDAEYNGVFNIAITASTGIAATLLGGKTVHSWSGLGIETEIDCDHPTEMMKRCIRNIRDADVLVIDEISMLPAYFFINLNKWMKKVRRSDKPFGGVQLVLIGDFLQLPPVENGANEHLNNRFAIQTHDWMDAGITHCFLDKTHRAKDTRLQELLLQIARGEVTEEKKIEVNQRLFDEPEEGRICTTLFTTNRNVDRYNQDRLDENPNPLRTFHMRRLSGDSRSLDTLIKSQNIPERVDLKVGATVMVTRNRADIGLVNGAIGRVIGFTSEGVNVLLNSGLTVNVAPELYTLEKKSETMVAGVRMTVPTPVAQISQIPLKLGYAITVHKSQGQTFDGVVVDLSKCFTPGLGYVALSRVSSMDDLFIMNINDKAFEVNPTSQKISNWVRGHAGLARKEFIANKDHYESLLLYPLSRSQKWSKSHKR